MLHNARSAEGTRAERQPQEDNVKQKWARCEQTWVGYEHTGVGSGRSPREAKGVVGADRARHCFCTTHRIEAGVAGRLHP